MGPHKVEGLIQVKALKRFTGWNFHALQELNELAIEQLDMLPGHGSGRSSGPCRFRQRMSDVQSKAALQAA